MSKEYFIYILASKRNGTLYIGVTNDLIKRVYQHKEKLISGFTRTYNVCMLVYYEKYADINSAIEREKKLKKYRRQWKINLIESVNPQWKDLYEQLHFDGADLTERNMDSATSAE
jgi:putative endonuclease